MFLYLKISLIVIFCSRVCTHMHTCADKKRRKGTAFFAHTQFFLQKKQK